MKQNKHLIATYCNQFKGDFLIDHWLYSLQQNVTLESIDILVIDFGLSEKQRFRLGELGVILLPAVAEGRMSNVHYKYLSLFLSEHPEYDQVLYSDCGDLVFQADISHIFEQGGTHFKAVQEPEFNFNLHRITLGTKDVLPEKIPIIKKALGTSPTFNCGFVMGPAYKMGKIWLEYSNLCHGVKCHGTDQLIINYLLFTYGVDILPRKFNYVLFLNHEKYRYNEQGLIENEEGVIPVVHNAGRYDFARSIELFGYKTGKLRRVSPFFFLWGYRLLRNLAGMGDWLKKALA